jgi:hypothetical protein
VRKEVRSLRRLSILTFTEKAIVTSKDPLSPGNEKLCSELSGRRSPRRPIPVPRAALRFIARSSKGALSKTLLSHIARGLTLKPKTGEICSAGTVKASWIAKTFNISVRSAKAARKELIEAGFISKDTGSFQRKLNRDGAYFRVNLEWTDKREITPAGEQGASPRISPRRAATHPNFAPPYKYRETSYESKNQKTQSLHFRPSGVCKANRKGEPTLRDVKPDDLKSFSRLKSLFEQAAAARWIRDSEAGFLNWVAAAVRAQTTKARSPVRVFVAIVRQGRWELITQAQEERARAAILRNRKAESSPGRFVMENRGGEGVSLSLLKLQPQRYCESERQRMPTHFSDLIKTAIVTR